MRRYSQTFLSSALFFSLLFFVSEIFPLASKSQNNPQFYLEWAIPLKKTLTQTNRREQGGVVRFGDDLLVAARSGGLYLFSTKGEQKLFAQFDGEFFIPPLVLDENRVVVSISNTVFMLELERKNENRARKLKQKIRDRSQKLNWKILWTVSGKAPVASVPKIYDKYLLIQFHDSSIYVVDKESGKLKSPNPNIVKNEEISILRLSSPIIVKESDELSDKTFGFSDKIVFGFSDGTIIFFELNRNDEREELVPFFKKKTAKSKFFTSFDKRDFFDILSIVPCKSGGSFLFSGGEYGGIVKERQEEIFRQEKAGNLQFFPENDGFVGFGKNGIFIFDNEGNFLSQPFKSRNYVANLLREEDFAIATTTGEGPMLGDSDGFIYLLSTDYKNSYHSVMIPNGISSKITCIKNELFFLSDMGVLYKFKVAK